MGSDDQLYGLPDYQHSRTEFSPKDNLGSLHISIPWGACKIDYRSGWVRIFQKRNKICIFHRHCHEILIPLNSKKLNSQHLLQFILSQGTISNIGVQVPTFGITNLTLWSGPEPDEFLKAFELVPKCSRYLGLLNKRVKLWGIACLQCRRACWQQECEKHFRQGNPCKRRRCTTQRSNGEFFVTLGDNDRIHNGAENHEKRFSVYNNEQMRNKGALIGLPSVAVIKKIILWKKKKASQRRKSVFCLTVQAGWHLSQRGRHGIRSLMPVCEWESREVTFRSHAGLESSHFIRTQEAEIEERKWARL